MKSFISIICGLLLSIIALTDSSKSSIGRKLQAMELYAQATGEAAVAVDVKASATVYELEQKVQRAMGIRVPILLSCNGQKLLIPSTQLADVGCSAEAAIQVQRMHQVNVGNQFDITDGQTVVFKTQQPDFNAITFEYKEGYLS